MNPWIKAARLRTLPLALSGILLGSALSKLCRSALITSTNSTHPIQVHHGNLIQGIVNHFLPSIVTVLAILTATGLQVLSNFANDYGDFRKGTDIKANRKDRMLASGEISEKNMKNAIWLTSIITLLLGTLLIFLSGLFETIGGYYLLALGLLALFSAITYTMGKNAYGYWGLGDFFVFLFFGLVPVLGMGLLNGLFLNPATTVYLDVFVMAGVGLGLLSVGVLNVNNYRDIPTDKEQNKQTVAVRLGQHKTLSYHKILLTLGGVLLPLSFIAFEKRYFEWPNLMGLQSIFLFGIFSPFFLLLSSHFRAVKSSFPGDRESLNPELKKLSITILSMVILYGILTFLLFDFPSV
mgnify:FL=1